MQYSCEVANILEMAINYYDNIFIHAATEQDPVSVCSYCSKSHAGIRWTVHQSTINKYPFGAYSIDIHFHCSDGETTVNNSNNNYNKTCTYPESTKILSCSY